MSANSNKLFYIFLGLSLFFSILVGIQLFQGASLRGWDGYYYALQIDSWFRTGTVQHPDGNLIFLLVTPLKWLGLNAENALRVWQAFSLFLFLASFSWILRTVKNVSCAWIAFSWAVLSPMLAYLDISFPKMFAFLICFNGVFYYTAKKPFKWVGWCLCACGAILLHRMAVAYVFLTIIWLFENSIKQVRQRKMMIGCILAVIIFFALLQMTNVFSFSLIDLSRITSGKMWPGAISLFFTYAYPALKRIELLCAAVALVGLLAAYRKNLRKIYLPILWCGLSFLPAFANNGLGLGERFGLLLPYFVVLSFIWLVHDEEKPIVAPVIKYHWLAVMLVVGSMVIGCFRLPYSMLRTDVENHAIWEQWMCFLQDKDVPMLVTPKGFNWFYKFRTGRESFPFGPEDHWPKDKIFRFVVGSSAAHLEPFVSKECKEQLIPFDEQRCGDLVLDACLIREDCWQEAWANITAATAPHIFPFIHHDDLNPMQKRPAFLYRKHKADHPDDPFPALPPGTK